MNSEHRRNGVIFIGVCAAFGICLFILDAGKDALSRPEAGAELHDASRGPATTRSTPEHVAIVTPPSSLPTTSPDVWEDEDGGDEADERWLRQATTTDSSALPDRARSFIARYFEVAQGGEDQAVPWLGQHYSETAHYFGEVKTRDAIIRDKIAYVRRWPERSYSIDPGTEAVECSSEKPLCRISGTVDWETGSVERGASASGKAAFVFVVLADGDVFTIVSETSRVLNRS